MTLLKMLKEEQTMLSPAPPTESTASGEEKGDHLVMIYTMVTGSGCTLLVCCTI